MQVTLNEQRRDDDGVIELTLKVPNQHTGVGPLTLVASLPPAYPYLAASVAAPSLQLGAHQHPFANTLCLLGRNTRNWATSDSLAWLITDQLRDAIASGTDTSAAPDRQEHQGEPFSDYYTYRPNAVVLVDSAWAVPDDVTCGEVSMRVAGQVDAEGVAPLTFLAERLNAPDGDALAELEPELLELWKHASPVGGRWSRLEQPVRADSAEALWSAAEKADQRVAMPLLSSGPDLEVQVRLVCFPEEHARNITGLGWLLLMRSRPAQPKGAKPARNARHGNPAKARPWTTEMVRAGRAGRTDLAARVPEQYVPLADRRVIVVGAGALGSVIVEHLARTGVGTIDIVDKDVLEPGNSTRHACTVAESGLLKAGAVAGLARRINPYLNAHAWHLPLGQAHLDADTQQRWADALNDADILVDASAETGVQAITADLARTLGKPWVSAEAVNGAWGGTIVTIPADAPWCRDCLMWHYNDGNVPMPEEDPAPMSQPVGCAEPTFTGTAADLAEVSAHAARTVLGVLSGDQIEGADVVELRRDGLPILPTWTHFQPGQHPQCRH